MSKITMNNIQKKNICSLQQLKSEILDRTPCIYISSGTSTVCPYHLIEQAICRYSTSSEFKILNLSTMPKKIEIRGEFVYVEGGVTWKELSKVLNQQSRDVMVYPTEELACVLASVATSATGERSFAFGPLREHIEEISFINYLGEICLLKSDVQVKKEFEKYQTSYELYDGLKNAPFPKYSREVDLLIGSEGQLGPITSVVLKTIALEVLSSFAIELPQWEENDENHIQIVEAIQAKKQYIRSCEFVDSHALSDGKRRDLILLQIKSDSIDELSEFLNLSLPIYEISNKKFTEIREGVPRSINEFLSREQAVKKGTDAQVRVKDLSKLFEIYRKASQMGVRYTLFGHIGDCHLHFNFLPRQNQTEICDKFLERFYDSIKALGGSPFAEHGIGFLKKAYIQQFYQQPQYEVFKRLKAELDPYNQFFPFGFMTLK